jgi:hypothetical protein
VTKHQGRNQVHAEYRAWLANQPCAICGAHGVQLAHCGIGGMGLKHGDDDQCAPLCRAHHEDHDQTKGDFARPRWLTKAQWRLVIQEWDAQAVLVYRAQFDARNTAPAGSIPC